MTIENEKMSEAMIDKLVEEYREYLHEKSYECIKALHDENVFVVSSLPVGVRAKLRRTL